MLAYLHPHDNLLDYRPRFDLESIFYVRHYLLDLETSVSLLLSHIVASRGGAAYADAFGFPREID